MTMYDVMYDVITEQYENGDITFEQANELNDLAYDKYVVETSKTSREKRDEIVAKQHGIDLKRNDVASYKKLADAKHKDRAKDYEKNEETERPNYKSRDPYDQKSIKSDYFLRDKNDDLVARELFVPKGKKTKEAYNLLKDRWSDRKDDQGRYEDEKDENHRELSHNARMSKRMDEARSKNTSTMEDIDEGKLKAFRHLNSKYSGDKYGNTTSNYTQEELFANKKKNIEEQNERVRNTKDKRHLKYIPDGDREKINDRKADEYKHGKNYINRRCNSSKVAKDADNYFWYNTDDAINKYKARDPYAKRERKKLDQAKLRPDEVKLANQNKHQWDKWHNIEDPDDTDVKDYLTRKINIRGDKK